MSDAPEIDGFSSLTLIGRGASGAVYRARQDAMSRDVAIKVLQASTTDPHARERFDREVRTLGELSGHPSIVTTYTSGVTADDRPYLVMDLMESDISRKAPAEISEAASMVKAAAEGLAEAHRRGVLHRDIKPANIFLDRYGRIRLGDFGLVGLSEAASITNASVGSPAYMAPELLANAKASVASDIYALAVTLYALVEGSLPFEASDAGVAGLFHAILSAPHRPPQGMGPHLSAFVDRCLAKDPAHRPQSAGDFISGIDAALDQDEATTSPGFPVAPVAAPPPAPHPGPVSSGPGFANLPPGGSPPTVGGYSSSSGDPYLPPAETSGGQGSSSGRSGLIMAAAIVGLLALVGGVVAFTQLGGDEATASPANSVVTIRSSAFAVPVGENEPIDAVDTSTGFLIEGGYIVTQRAPAVAESFTVEVGDTELDAELVGMSECAAVSVLEVDPDDVADRHVFEWSDARIGVGNNLTILGYDVGGDFEEFSADVVSEAGPAVGGLGVHELQFELDEQIPRTALGGPVLDREGSVAGMALATANEGTSVVSVDELAGIVDEIIDVEGDVDGIGIGLRAVADSISVTAVRPDSPAAAVGLQPGDRIQDINDAAIVLEDDPLAAYCDQVADIGDDPVPIDVDRDGDLYFGEINGAELVQESTTELDYEEVRSEDGTLLVDIPTTWEVFDDPGTADYSGAVLSAQGEEGFLEYSVQGERTPDELIDIMSSSFTDDPLCTVGEPVEYVDGVFTGLEAPIDCTDTPDAIRKVIAAVDDQSGTTIALVYSFDGSAAEEFSSSVEFSFLLVE